MDYIILDEIKDMLANRKDITDLKQFTNMEMEDVITYKRNGKTYIVSVEEDFYDE